MLSTNIGGVAPPKDSPRPTQSQTRCLAEEVDKLLRPGTEQQRLIWITTARGSKNMDLPAVLVDVGDVDEAQDRGGADGLGWVADLGIHDGHGVV